MAVLGVMEHGRCEVAVVANRGERKRVAHLLDSAAGLAADERGRELEIIAVPLDGGDLLVIHVMPTILRRRNG